jgi:membrane protein DedA with SNARE-associated domain
MNFLTDLFNHYGYVVLFVALFLELIAFPTPGETLMTYCGFLVYQGKLSWGISVFVAALGVISGITISYFMGRTLGTSFFRKYGSYVHLGPDKLEKTSQWFERYGNGLLLIAYFIPGVRHITGYFSGIAKIPYKKFALNAYIGAFIWTGTFISLGKILGSDWEKFHGSIKKYLIIGGIILAITLLCVYLYRRYKVDIISFIMKSIKKGILFFHSLGKIKVVIVGVAAMFIALSIVLIGLIQDFLADEFSQFDRIVSYLVNIIFQEYWSDFMGIFKFLTSPELLVALTLLILAWIILKGRNRLLEARFHFITVVGGGLLEEGLRLLFHREGPISGSVYTFPSQQAFLAVVVYGFASFLVLRHAGKRWFGLSLLFMTIGICIVTGLTEVFFQVQYPSDVGAGYVFGGVWLSLNLILMEVFRALPNITSDPR